MNVPILTSRKPLRSGKKNCDGYTLIDVVITSLIIGILSAVAAPSFVKSLYRNRVDAAAKRIQVDLAFARQTAISRSGVETVQFTTATSKYVIPGLDSLDHPGNAYELILNRAPYHCTIVSAALGGDSDLQFDRYGTPDSGGTITIQSGSYQRILTIDPDTGKATIS